MRRLLVAVWRQADSPRRPIHVAGSSGKPHRPWMSLAIAIGFLTTGSAWAGSTFDYLTFDAPAGVQSPIGVSIATGISNNGVIIGNYYTSDATSHGYILQNGVYSYFDAPGAGTGNFYGTITRSINSFGQAIVGSYDSTGETEYLYAGGHFTPIAEPLATPTTTTVMSINDRGIATGYYFDGNVPHGFQYNTTTGTFTGIPDVPGSSGTYATATATNGDVVVYYYDSQTFQSHIAVEHDGVYTEIPDLTGALAIRPTGITASGVIAGWYEDSSFNDLGFEYINGTYYTLDAPGATWTVLYGINDAGQAVGYWSEASGEAHSLLATPVPEPSALSLLGIGGACLAAYTRRRARAA